MEFEEIKEMTDVESQLFARQVLSGNSPNDVIQNDFLHLSICGHVNALRIAYPDLIRRKIFYPSEIYLHADDRVADSLVEILEKSTSMVEINHLLSCLAWIGSEKVIQYLRRSDLELPPWAKTLYIVPTRYSEVAGWTIDSHGKRIDLVSSEVICLGSDQMQIDAEREFETFVYKDEKCPFCGNALVTLFSFPSIKGEGKVDFTTCLCCSCYNPVFMKIDQNGKSHWHESNQVWEHLDPPIEMDVVERNTLRPYKKSRPATYSISPFIPVSKSQIGGFPTWIQDSDYMSCPSCQSKMRFIGQIDMEDVMKYGEGIYYFQFCEHCKITGTNYQQT